MFLTTVKKKKKQQLSRAVRTTQLSKTAQFRVSGNVIQNTWVQQPVLSEPKLNITSVTSGNNDKCRLLITMFLLQGSSPHMV